MNNKNKFQQFQFSPKVTSLQVNLKNIIYQTGYSSKSEFPNYDLLKSLLNEIKNIIKPVSAFVVIPKASSTTKNSSLDIGGVQFYTAGIISYPLKQISRAVFFVASIGKEFDEFLIEKKKETDSFTEYLVNLIGSEITESLVEWTYEKIIEYAKKENIKWSNKYSPGYCGWNVNEQKKIFGFFSENICGITLTESSLMLPIKSVSGLVALGKDITWHEYPCDICKVPHCYKNRRSILV